MAGSHFEGSLSHSGMLLDGGPFRSRDMRDRWPRRSLPTVMLLNYKVVVDGKPWTRDSPKNLHEILVVDGEPWTKGCPKTCMRCCSW